jgi:hypothetical protein
MPSYVVRKGQNSLTNSRQSSTYKPDQRSTERPRRTNTACSDKGKKPALQGSLQQDLDTQPVQKSAFLGSFITWHKPSEKPKKPNKENTTLDIGEIFKKIRQLKSDASTKFSEALKHLRGQDFEHELHLRTTIQDWISEINEKLEDYKMKIQQNSNEDKKTFLRKRSNKIRNWDRRAIPHKKYTLGPTQEYINKIAKMAKLPYKLADPPVNEKHKGKISRHILKRYLWDATYILMNAIENMAKQEKYSDDEDLQKFLRLSKEGKLLRDEAFRYKLALPPRKPRQPRQPRQTHEAPAAKQESERKVHAHAPTKPEFEGDWDDDSKPMRFKRNPMDNAETDEDYAETNGNETESEAGDYSDVRGGE